MEFFQWLRQVVCRLCQRSIQSLAMIYRPLNYDNESTMAQRSSVLPVHQLWPPSEGNQRTELDVVLFHGLQLTANDTSDAWSSTWTQRGHDDVCWPRDWLPYDLGEAVRIFSVSYNADIVSCPYDHVSEIAHNLSQNLMNPRYEWDYPIVLIGHSFGGLVLKSLVVQLNRASTNSNPTNSWSKSQQESAKMFLSNLRGVAFYAVPHAGSSNIRKYVIKLLKCNRRDITGIMRNIHPRQGDMEQLSVDFGRIVTEKDISVYAFCEGRPMEQTGILVDKTSARRAAEDNFYKIEDADHVEVCKPPSKEHPSYELLLGFILTCGKVEDANHMEVCKPPSKEHPSYQLLLEFIIICGKVSKEYEQALQEVRDLRQSTFGLESYVERVEALLTSGGSDVAPKYVGVWGMGGVGKSLFLQTLYARAQVHNHFRGVKFIRRTVGQSPNILSLYRSLSEELGLKPQENLNQEDYKPKLLSMFQQKRVFLVLDDIWEDKVFDSLDLAKGKGSVTLLSTRNKSLFERPSPQISQVHITPLSGEDSWKLFCVHAFGPQSNVPNGLKETALSMAKECQGLPLALKVIGGSMFGKYPFSWKPVLKKLTESRMHEGPVVELYERLKVGYELLSDRLKKCFHYFAAFPENSEIVFEEILFHWIGEGLVPGHYNDDPRADALSLLEKLCERSFIETNGQFDSNQCYLLDFKVHDVMRDLAVYLLENNCGTPHSKQPYLYRAGQNLEGIPQEWKVISQPPESECTTILEVLRLSLDTNKFETLPEFYAPELVFLLLGRNPIVSLPADFSNYFPKLCILNLRNGQFRSLPDEVGDFKNLICLDLSNCHQLETLPETIRKISKLKFLILDDCWSLKNLPSGLIILTSLQVLHTAHCGQLRWAEHALSRTARAGFGHLYSTVGALLEDVCQLVDLTELTIFAEELPLMLNLFQLPQNNLPPNTCSLTKLRLLQVCLEITNFPAEISCRCLQLQELELYSSMLKNLPASFTARGAFPALVQLTLSCPNLVTFPEVDEGAFPKLQILDMSGCECRRSILSVRSVELLCSLSLRSFIVENCEWYISEMSSTWVKRDIKERCNKVPWVGFWSNTRRYTFNSYHNFETTFEYLKWRKEDRRRRHADMELLNLI